VLAHLSPSLVGHLRPSAAPRHLCNVQKPHELSQRARGLDGADL